MWLHFRNHHWAKRPVHVGRSHELDVPLFMCHRAFTSKNMQNLARFRTTSKFGGEYLRNGWRYSKSDFYSVYRDSSCVRRNKFGEVWSSDLGDLDVESYPPIVHISAPRGCCAPKLLHALENHQVLLAHPPPGMGPPLQLFSKGGQKLA